MGRDRFSTLFAVVRLKGLQASHTRYRAVLYKSDARIAAGPSKGIAVSFLPSSFTRKYKIVGDHSIYRIMCVRAVCVCGISRAVYASNDYPDSVVEKHFVLNYALEMSSVPEQGR